MENYNGSDVDELFVPKDQELFGGLPSPENLSPCGVTVLGSFHFPEKRLVIAANSMMEELYFEETGICEEIDIENSVHDGNSYSSMCQGLNDDSLHWTSFLQEQLNFQPDDEAKIEEMDDIFLSSFLGLTSLDGFHGLFSPKFQYSMIPADNLFTDPIPETQYVPGDIEGVENSECLKKRIFSQSTCWENGEVSTSCPSVKRPASMSSQQDSVNGLADEETSVEEFVLEELERVITQLTKKTRICFRDALYRLGEHSKQHALRHGQNVDFILEKRLLLTEQDKTLSLGKTGAAESKTNAIDRAIASLMFSKVN